MQTETAHESAVYSAKYTNNAILQMLMMIKRKISRTFISITGNPKHHMTWP